jgi:hypothetical protein
VLGNNKITGGGLLDFRSRRESVVCDRKKFFTLHGKNRSPWQCGIWSVKNIHAAVQEKRKFAFFHNGLYVFRFYGAVVR